MVDLVAHALAVRPAGPFLRLEGHDKTLGDNGKPFKVNRRSPAFVAGRLARLFLGELLRLFVGNGEAVEMQECIKQLIGHAEDAIEASIPVGVGDDSFRGEGARVGNVLLCEELQAGCSWAGIPCRAFVWVLLEPLIPQGSQALAAVVLCVLVVDVNGHLVWCGDGLGEALAAHKCLVADFDGALATGAGTH
jgi:hypothetical protein